jgi:hypothetical protein
MKPFSSKRSRLHRCPVIGCPAQIPIAHFMCPSHWHLVPASMKKAVIDAYRGQPLGDSHVAAMDAAIKAISPHAKEAAA